MCRITVIFLCWLGLLPSCYGFSMSIDSIEQRVVGFVHKTIESLNYSRYKMGGSHFDPAKGVYIVDCSNYVDQILQTVSPQSYLSLVDYTGTDNPTTQHYYDFFSELSDNPYWDKIENVEKLKPGDIIVFRYKKNRRSATKGHVMIVMDKPIRGSDAYLVRVSDSAPIGHSQDTRPYRTSGVGIGTLLLKVNPKTGRPAAYAWKEGSCWKNHVNFAMARPVINQPPSPRYF